MLVRCIKADGSILKEGELYNVINFTSEGNYKLEGVRPPEGFNCFDADRFEIEDDSFPEWTEEMEQDFWDGQPTDEYN